DAIAAELPPLAALDPQARIAQRREKFMAMGRDGLS
ncbi:acetyl-CoA carboxylase carboxyl transferase subunit alpha, partial [Nguyenibacter vanlangensis]|nr:acetyl-CoA carboxylase carboxyl transferase subunit alpha [Nguyenibacter vanlangensis]